MKETNHACSPQPIISVITPCCNSAEYILETLQSVFSQTFPDFEMIAMDDGSTDNTVEILTTFSQSEPRLKVYTQNNQGQSLARARAIQYAQGQYLFCLDSDDKIAPTCLEKMFQAAQTHHADIVYSDLRQFEAKTDEAGEPFSLLMQLLINHFVISVLVNKKKYEEIGGFDTSMKCFEDWELWVRMVKNGAKIHYIPEVLFFYRQRANQTSVTDTTTHHEAAATLHIYTKHQDFYHQNNLSLREIFQAAYAWYDYKKKYYTHPIRRWYYQTFQPQKWQKLCKKYHFE